MGMRRYLSVGTAVIAAVLAGSSALAATSVQIGNSGATFASSTIACATNPDTGNSAPMIEAGLYRPKSNAKGTVSLNGGLVANVTAASPSARVWLPEGDNTVVVAVGKKVADSYAFHVPAGMCAPDTSGNTISPDGLWETGASGKSSATVTPGCAWNPATGRAQPYVHLVDNGNYLLNVSVNGTPLTQLSATNPHVAVFLGAGQNIISAANGALSTDYYIRDGGTGSCALP